jgi:hypothetical protein
MTRNIDTKRKSIQIADLGKFEVHVFAPIYKQFQVDEDLGYIVDDITGENIGQVLSLVILPDGSFEEPHHSVVSLQSEQTIKLTLENIPYTGEYLDWLATEKTTESTL